MSRYHPLRIFSGDANRPLAESIALADVNAFSLIISVGGRVELQ